ncbi:unnamed protein product [Mycena citricolor]|uniref:Acyl-coenzyme A oxidase n=1 Tax=Mycena citricolor TaxID=2018698 RepID=A0AAD2HLX1_9AGAR|nr:unnamed protein product [Mycena citricolor]
MANRQIQLMNEARARATFDPRKLTYIIYGGPEAVHAREAAFATAEKKMDTTDMDVLPAEYGDVTRSEMYIQGLKMGKAMIEERTQRGTGIFEWITPKYWLANSSPYGLHFMMFTPSLKLLGSDEQAKYWVPLAEQAKILGCYCQTELAHGSALRDLETTATFDRATDEWVLHCPTTESIKYWPGGLGFSVTHAIVMARLIIGPKDYGVHPYIVQLRSLEDFTPLPGVELGDVGLKMGHNTNDNGYAKFTHFRIPRANLLMRYQTVDREGNYTSTPGGSSRLSYGTMLYARVNIAAAIPMQLAQAATIALRFSLVREQGALPFETDESKRSPVPILAFPMLSLRIFMVMSRAFATWFSAQEVAGQYQNLLARQAKGDHAALPGVHALLAALKAYSAQTLADGTEEARRCTGGHGYLSFSGFGLLVPAATVIATIEGDTYVMYQQAARYLIKCVTTTRATWDPNVAYLYAPASQPLPSTADFGDIAVLLQVFQHRSIRLIKESAAILAEAQADGKLSFSQAWNKHMVRFVAAARAHIEFLVLRSFAKAAKGDSPEHKVLERLCVLYGLTCIEGLQSEGVGFTEDGYLTAVHLSNARKVVNVLLEELSVDAAAIADSWNFTDASLASAIGCYDGDIYTRMMKWTEQAPINVEARKNGGVIKEGYEGYLRPVLTGRL